MKQSKIGRESKINKRSMCIYMSSIRDNSIQDDVSLCSSPHQLEVQGTYDQKYILVHMDYDQQYILAYLGVMAWVTLKAIASFVLALGKSAGHISAPPPDKWVA